MTARARLVLFVLCAAQFMVALDFSILNIALPTLGPDIGLSEADLQWAVTAFALPSGGFLLLFGRLGDVIGRRKIFIGGLVLFILASVLAATSWDATPFLIARAAQGLAAAAIVPTGMALLTTSFAEGPLRDRALGISGMLLSLGFTIGMVFGGVLTEVFGWRSTMALGVFMAGIVLVSAPLLLRESRATQRQRLDVPGAVTVSGGLLAVIYAVSSAAQRGWAQPDVLLALVVGAALLVTFAVVESRAEHPLVAIRVLRMPTVAWGNLGGIVTFSMMSAVMFLITLYLQQVLGLSPVISGLVFGVMGVISFTTGAIAPRLVGRFGSQRMLVAGLLIQAACIATLLLVGSNEGMLLAAAAGSAGCVGHLIAIVSYGITATSGLTDDLQGLATGLVTTAQQMGLTIGVPVIAAVAAAHTAALRSAGSSTADALLGGYRLGFGVDAAIVACTALVIGLFLRRRDRSESLR
jgi:MFS family permease